MKTDFIANVSHELKSPLTSIRHLMDLLHTNRVKTYRTVKIGNQEWMGQNLNDRFQEKSGSFCYKWRESNCDTYGLLYTFEAANQVCPKGWRLPSDED